MALAFSDTVNNTGILQQTRKFMRVDSTQWPTVNVVNSCNNWLDTIVGYALGADRRFQWDDTNHTTLPEGTMSLTLNTSDFSYLTDEQSNKVITLTGVSILIGGYYVPLTPVDRNDPDIDLSTFGATTGTPTAYDKIADNIIRLDKKVSATVAAGLKFFFQRTPSYFAATDTTKTQGFSPIIDRGFVIASAFDGALTLGLKNLQGLSVELEKERDKMLRYFSVRDYDEVRRMSPAVEDNH